MTSFTQATRPIALRTPLGDDVALLARLHGSEAISDLFHFTLDLLAEQPLPFDQLLGQTASVRLDVPGCPRRWINGIVVVLEEGRTVQGPQGGITFHRYRAELAPALWLLGQRKQSRVFQDRSVPDIVLPILKTEWRLDVETHLVGTYPARDYCVQFRETDLAFVRRLLEEEGIYFFFKHESARHTLVLADNPSAHANLGDALPYDAATGGRRPEGRVTDWRKQQELRPVKYMLRDYSFQLPTNSLDSRTHITDEVRAGQVTHQLGIDPKQRSEVYEHPGGYGWRFDGVGVSGQIQPDNVQNLFKDNERLAQIRMQEVAARAVVIHGESLCGHLAAGAKFTLSMHHNGNGDYLLTRVEHRAELEESYLGGSDATERLYDNRFEAVPASVPYRPARVTPRPVIHGVQTAVVVGPPGSDLFVDKYGRVKVKFFWDRDPRTGPESSCWLRVAQVWAGNRWGAYFWPRVGHEVVVHFNEGNPDRPLVVGSVYNENNMPPFELPGNRMLGGIKSFTSTGDANSRADPLANFNGIVFNDEKGKEQIELHGEKHVAFFGERSHEHTVDGWHQLNVNGMHRVHVGSVPGGSGSGGGAAGWVTGGSPPFTYSGTVGTGDIGTSLSTICGLSQSVVLGASTYLVVGQEFNIMMNPFGVAADLLIKNNPANMLIGSVGKMAGNPLTGAAGGDTDLYMGTYSFVVYGQSISINRSGRTAIASDLTWRGRKNLGGLLTWALVSELLAGILVAYTTGVTIAAAMDAYKDTTKWDIMVGVGEALAEVLAATDVFIGTAVQLAKAAEELAASGEVAADPITLKNIVGVIKAITAPNEND